MFLITGAGRSGTQYIASVLRRCGLDVGHERMGRDGIVSGFYAVDAAHYPGRNHPAPRPQFDVILHQTRHPLRSIASIQTGRSRGWAQQFVDVERDAPPLRWACYYWLTWTQHAERLALWSYRIEALPSVWVDLQAALCFDAPYVRVAGVPTNLHARPHSNVTWGDVQTAAPEICADIRAAARRYGYAVSEED